MKTQQILPGLYQFTIDTVNVFLLHDKELILIDTGTKDRAHDILDGIRDTGYSITDIDHILVTHCHQDHAGGLATIKQASGASIWMHSMDADLVEEGEARRTWTPTPGILNRILYWIYVRGAPRTIPPTAIGHRIDGDCMLPMAHGVRAFHVPGHCAGQLAFLWPRHGGFLFAADTAINVLRLQLPLVHEDLEQGWKSLQRLSSLTFDKAVFGHGKPIMNNAANQFRKKFGKAD